MAYNKGGEYGIKGTFLITVPPVVWVTSELKGLFPHYR